MEDNTCEFWRTRFVELQKINMRAAGRERMNMETAPALIKEFEEKNPGVNSKVTVNETNVDWEIILSAELKMRFFVQNQVVSDTRSPHIRRCRYKRLIDCQTARSRACSRYLCARPALWPCS